MTNEVLSDPAHPVTALMLYLFSMESFIHPIITADNTDLTKAETLGAFQAAIYQIIWFASFYRDDIDKFKLMNSDLYRGAALPMCKIEEFKELIGQKWDEDID